MDAHAGLEYPTKDFADLPQITLQYVMHWK